MANRELHNNGTARLSISLRVTSAMPELPMLAKGPNIHEHFPMGLALLALMLNYGRVLSHSSVG